MEQSTVVYFNPTQRSQTKFWMAFSGLKSINVGLLTARLPRSNMWRLLVFTRRRFDSWYYIYQNNYESTRGAYWMRCIGSEGLRCRPADFVMEYVVMKEESFPSAALVLQMEATAEGPAIFVHTKAPHAGSHYSTFRKATFTISRLLI